MTRVGAMPVVALSADAVIRINAGADLGRVAKALVEAEVGALAVEGDGGRIESIVSERDVVRALAEGRDPAATRAGDIASATLVPWSPQAAGWVSAAVPVAIGTL